MLTRTSSIRFVFPLYHFESINYQLRTSEHRKSHPASIQENRFRKHIECHEELPTSKFRGTSFRDFPASIGSWPRSGAPAPHRRRARNPSAPIESPPLGGRLRSLDYFLNYCLVHVYYILIFVHSCFHTFSHSTHCFVLFPGGSPAPRGPFSESSQKAHRKISWKKLGEGWRRWEKV